MFENFKEAMKYVKQIKKAKSVIMLRCTNCGFIDLTLLEDTLIENTELRHDNTEIKEVEYGVFCNKCKSISYIKEVWSENTILK